MKKARKQNMAKLSETQWTEMAVAMSGSEGDVVRGWVRDANAALISREWDSFFGYAEQVVARCANPTVRRCFQEALAMFPMRYAA